jgi:hypothetical protein
MLRPDGPQRLLKVLGLPLRERQSEKLVKRVMHGVPLAEDRRLLVAPSDPLDIYEEELLRANPVTPKR